MEHGSFYHVLTYRFSWRYGTLYFNLDTLTQFLECRERFLPPPGYFTSLKYEWYRRAQLEVKYLETRDTAFYFVYLSWRT